MRTWSDLWWWLPVALAGIYAALVAFQLPALIAHTWWSADSGSAGVVAQLYSRPPPGQYIVLGNHGWYEALSAYLLTRGLPAHRLLWYALPIAAWIATIALIGASARRAFGRYGGGLAIAGLLCLAPGGLMLIFQPTAHTNVVFHAAALALVAGWVLPRIMTLPLPAVVGTGLLIGAFTGLAIAGDGLALLWAVLPFVVAMGVCAWRRPLAAVLRTLAFALTTLIGMLLVTVLFTAIMRNAGIRVDQLAQSEQMQFVKPGALAANVGKMLNELAYLVGGNFLGHRMNRTGLIEMVSGGMLLLGGAAAVYAICRASRTGERPGPGSGTDANAVSPRLVHVAFWSTCLAAGLMLFVLSALGSVDYRYLVGPVVAIAALLPVAAARSTGWRLAIAVGLAVMVLAGLARLDTRSLPYLPRDVPLAQRDLSVVTRFAHRHHATDGYAVYWDAVTITWHTKFAVRLHPVIRCGPPHRYTYCPLYHADSFTDSYVPRRGLRTLFIRDSRFRSKPPASWGKPIASQRVGRLTVYAYRYDIAQHFPKPRPGQIRRLITGHGL